MERLRLAWSYAKGEFIVTDHYYFSILRSLLNERYDWRLLRSFEEIEEFNPHIIIFNYPEKPFSDDEVATILRWLEAGKGVAMFSYYLDEDEVSSNLNRVLSKLSLRVNYDEVRAPQSCYKGDDLLLVTDRLHPWLRAQGISEVMLACTSSVEVDEQSVPLVYSPNGEKVLVAYRDVGKGRLVYGGTCVFWDNFSIEKYDNQAYSLAILKLLAEGI